MTPSFPCRRVGSRGNGPTIPIVERAKGTAAQGEAKDVVWQKRMVFVTKEFLVWLTKPREHLKRGDVAEAWSNSV